MPETDTLMAILSLRRLSSMKPVSHADQPRDLNQIIHTQSNILHTKAFRIVENYRSYRSIEVIVLPFNRVPRRMWICYRIFSRIPPRGRQIHSVMSDGCYVDGDPFFPLPLSFMNLVLQTDQRSTFNLKIRIKPFTHSRGDSSPN